MSERLDTIYALSSGGLPSGVAVVRVSGSQVRLICLDVCGSVPRARQARLLPIRKRNGELIDTGLVIFFESPKSFTGEDCIEFQLHGGRAVVNSVLDTLSGFENTRHAEPGEFTRRAFDAGKLDLVEVEGLADLISSETEMQRRLAIEQSSGGHTAIYMDWARRLLHARAMIEAELDFADEGDVPGSVADQVWADMENLKAEIRRVLDSMPLGQIIRDGLNVVIYGAPNAGKSSLLNALSQREIAIVTPVPGTTRDVLSVDVNIGGYLVHLKDTAGIRTTNDVVEIEGIRRANDALLSADLILHLVDLSVSAGNEDLLVETDLSVMRIGTKRDVRLPTGAGQAVDIEISVKTGEGIDSLMKRISSHIESRLQSCSGSILSRKRHEQHLLSAEAAIAGAIGGVDVPLEIRAEFLRDAGNSIGRITGRVDTEMLLGVIFSEFCIGK